MSLISKFRWFFAPSIVQAGVAFATFPLATLILGPEDYGAYAVVTAITGLASSTACLGSSYLLAQVFSSKKSEDIRQLVSQQVAISSILAVTFGAVLIVGWGYIDAYFDTLSMIPSAGFVLSAIGTLPGTVGAIALDVLTLDGRAKVFAKILIGQSLLSAGVLLFCLFILDFGAMSLFVAGIVGNSSLGLGGLVSLRGYLETPSFQQKDLLVFKGALAMTGANFMEVAYQPVERNLLAVSTGLTSVGLYTHAQQYRTVVAVAVKALSRSIWPVTLEEAREEGLHFAKTERYWALAHACLALVGLIFAVVGDELIGLLSHGKFVGAGAYAALGIAFLLVQNSGKPHTGFMFAHGEVGPYSRLSILATIAGLGCAVFTIPMLGVWGALLSFFLQQLVIRVSIQMYIGRMAKVPFQDGCAVVGLLLILALTSLKESFQPGFWVQLGLLASAVGLQTLAYWSMRGSVTYLEKIA